MSAGRLPLWAQVRNGGKRRRIATVDVDHGTGILEAIAPPAHRTVRLQTRRAGVDEGNHGGTKLRFRAWRPRVPDRVVNPDCGARASTTTHVTSFTGAALRAMPPLAAADR